MFKPVLNSIKEKKKRREKLESEIEEKETELLKLEKEKDEEIVSFQKHVKKKYPFVKQVIFDKSQEVTKKVKKKKIDKEKFEEKIVDLLASKVPDGY